MNAFLPVSLFLSLRGLGAGSGVGAGRLAPGAPQPGSAPGVHVTLTVKVMSVDP